MAVRHQNKRRIMLLGQDSNSLVWLIAVNAAVFVLLNFIKIVYLISYADTAQATALYQSQIIRWLEVPASWHEFIHKPWTILTYMFTHESIWALIGNMMWLWAFGYILQDLAGGKKLIPIYIYGGIAGVIFFLIGSNLLFGDANNSLLLLTSANTSVLAVAVATTTLAPTYRIFPMLGGGISLWIATTIFIALDYAFVGGGNGSIAIAHAAACIMGFIFIYQLRRGYDLGKWINDISLIISELFNPDIRSNSFSKEKKKLPASSNKLVDASQQRIDELLDKINLKGIQELSEEEKEFLKHVGKEIRNEKG